MHTKFWLEQLNGRDYIRDLDVDGKLMSISEKVC